MLKWHIFVIFQIAIASHVMSWVKRESGVAGQLTFSKEYTILADQSVFGKGAVHQTSTRQAMPSNEIS